MIAKNLETNKIAFLNITDNESQIPNTTGKEQRFSYLGKSFSVLRSSGSLEQGTDHHSCCLKVTQ